MPNKVQGGKSRKGQESHIKTKKANATPKSNVEKAKGEQNSQKQICTNSGLAKHCKDRKEQINNKSAAQVLSLAAEEERHFTYKQCWTRVQTCCIGRATDRRMGSSTGKATGRLGDRVIAVGDGNGETRNRRPGNRGSWWAVMGRVGESPPADRLLVCLGVRSPDSVKVLRVLGGL